MNWQKVPFLRILLPFIVGIIFCEYTHTSHQGPIIFGIGISGLYTILYLFKFRFKNRPKLILNLFLQLFCILGGMLLHDSHQENKLQHYFKNQSKGHASYWVQIKEIGQQDSKRLKAVVDVLLIKNKHEKTEKCVGSARISLKPGNQIFDIGDWILLNEEPQAIESPIFPWQFDFQKFAKNKQLYHQFFIKSNYRLIKNNSNSIAKSTYNSKKRIENTIKSEYLKKEDIGLVLALLTGDKSDLDEEMKNNFSKTGTMHVLAVSGLHVALVFSLLNFIFQILKKVPYGSYLHLFLVLSGLWYFAFITGLGNSVLRASMMFSLAQCAKLFKRKNISMNSVMACAFLLLFNNSNALFDIGFQLSFAAVFGIIYSQEFEIKYTGKFKSVKKHLIESLKISLFAQLFTLPIILYNFHQFPVYFLLSNLLIIPLTSILMYGIIVHLLLQTYLNVSILIMKFNSCVIFIMDTINSCIGRFKYSLIENINITAISSILLYFVFLLFLKSIKTKNKVLLIHSLIVFSLTILENQIGYHLNQQKSKTYQIEKQLYACVNGQNVYVLTNFENTKQNTIEKLEKQIRNSHYYMLKNNIDLTKNSKTDKFWIKKGLGFQIFDTIMTGKIKNKKSVKKSQIDYKNRQLKNLYKLVNH